MFSISILRDAGRAYAVASEDRACRREGRLLMPMPIKLTPAPIDGILLAETGLFRDDRGFITETWSEPVWREAGFGATFVQDIMSCSARGALRGMHYQIEPHGMGKLIRVVRGAVYDAAVDLRRGSPSFGKWFGVELSEANAKVVWIPAGFAHGFVSLEDDSLVYYKCDAAHTPEAERSLNYRCPDVGIEWPIDPVIVSKKDAAAPMLKDAEYNFTYAPQGA